MKNKPRFTSLSRLILAGSAALLLSPSAQAAVATWGNTGTDFNLDANWSGSVSPVAGGTAAFVGAAVTNPNLSASLSIGQLFFATDGIGYTLTSSTGAALTLGAVGTNSTIVSGSNTTGTNTIASALVLTAGTKTIGIGGGSTMVLSGNISETGGAAALTLSRIGVASGISTFTLSGNNTFSGGVTLSAAGGILNIGSATALGSGTLRITTTSGCSIYNTAGSSLTFANNVLAAGNALNFYNGDFTFTGSTTLAYSQVSLGAFNNTVTFSGVIREDATGGRALRKDGLGTLILGDANTYTGYTTVSGGILSISKIGKVGDTSSSLGGGSSVLNLGAAGSGNNSTLVYTGQGETTDRNIILNYTGGNTAIQNDGAGALILTNLTNTLIGNKTFTLSGSNTGNNKITSIIGDTTGKVTTLTKSGIGKWILSGDNTYTGVTTVNAGTLQFAKKTSLYNGSAASWISSKIKVASGAALGLNVGGSSEFEVADVASVLAMGGNATTGFMTGSIIGLDTTNAVGGNFDYTNVIGNAYAGSTLGLTKLGDNTLTLSNANTYTGATTVSAGRLNVNGSLAAGSAVSVASGATLGGSGTVNGNVAVAGGTVDGSGLQLQGANTFTGASTLAGTTTASSINVTSGTTNISGAIVATGGVTADANTTLKINGSVTGTVIASGILGGNGTISGATTVNGTLAPGNSIGTLNTGDLSLAATSDLDIELGRDGANAISDRTNVTGSVDIVSGADLKLTLFGDLSSPLLNDIFFLIDNDDTDEIVGTFSSLNGVATTLAEGSRFDWNSQQWEITYKADAGNTSFTQGNDLAIMVVPEPSTWALLTGGVGMLIAIQGMRRRSRVS